MACAAWRRDLRFGRAAGLRESRWDGDRAKTAAVAATCASSAALRTLAALNAVADTTRPLFSALADQAVTCSEKNSLRVEMNVSIGTVAASIPHQWGN